MGYLAAAILCAAVIGACVWTGSILSILGVCIYAYLDRYFSAELKRQRGEAYDAGYRKGQSDGERLKKYNESELPKTRMEAEETKAWSEGLAALYPQDAELQAEVKRIRDERKLLDSTG